MATAVVDEDGSEEVVVREVIDINLLEVVVDS